MEETILASLLGGLFIFLFVLVFIGLILYIFGAIGLMKMAQKKQIPNAWLAFIPIGNAYILGSIIEPVSLGQTKIPNARYILLITIALATISGIPVIGQIIGLLAAIIFFIALYKLYEMYAPDKAVLFLVLSILLGFLTPIFIFVLRNKEPKKSDIVRKEETEQKTDYLEQTIKDGVNGPENQQPSSSE